MFSIMHDMVSKYFGTTKFKLDILDYIYRNPTRIKPWI